MREELEKLAKQASDIHGRVVRGQSSEFERAALLRDLQALSVGIHRVAHQVGELGSLIMTLGGDDDRHPPGGRAA
jgi:hypothetical protein